MSCISPSTEMLADPVTASKFLVTAVDDVDKRFAQIREELIALRQAIQDAENGICHRSRSNPVNGARARLVAVGRCDRCGSTGEKVLSQIWVEITELKDVIENASRALRVSAAKDISKPIRVQLLKVGLCAYCGSTGDATKRQNGFDIDHVVPVAAGGGNEPSNLTLACIQCNASKSDALPTGRWFPEFTAATESERRA